MDGTDTDRFPPVLLQFLAVARAELDEHVNHGGRCTVCQVSFPCQRAAQADLALGAF